jgi:hypothetical protein
MRTRRRTETREDDDKELRGRRRRNMGEVEEEGKEEYGRR